MSDGRTRQSSVTSLFFRSALGPSSEKNSPPPISSETLLTATVSPKHFVTFLRSILPFAVISSHIEACGTIMSKRQLPVVNPILSCYNGGNSPSRAMPYSSQCLCVCSIGLSKSSDEDNSPENSPVSCHSTEILEDTPILYRTIVVAARRVGFDWRLLIFRFAFPTFSTTTVPPISQIFTAFTRQFLAVAFKGRKYSMSEQNRQFIFASRPVGLS